MNIAVIINSYNRLSLLRESLDALEQWMPQSVYHGRLGIVIYDAGSTDGTIEWIQGKAIQKYSFTIKLLLPQKGDDTSFAAGVNAGAYFAVEYYDDLQYLLLYETDNQILSSSALLAAERELMNHSILGACGFTVRYHNGCRAGVGMPFPTIINFLLWKFGSIFHLEKIPYQWEEREQNTLFSYVDVVFTSPLLIKKQAWIDSKGLDARTFPFSDCDVDWAKRLRILNWRMGVIKTEDVIHDNRDTISDWSKTRAMNSHRARLRYFKRYHPFLIYIIFPFPLMMRHLFELFIALIYPFPKSKKKRLINQFYNLLIKSLKGYS
ncbi:MAG: hypothetical protein LBE13_14335 [Bacteroidales bacterium]|jgi:GT2 family glycosyltransferase|nr:hypothetical protein [Bacteroidales bacterium]